MSKTPNKIEYPSNKPLTLDDLPKEFDSWTNLYNWWYSSCIEELILPNVICIPILGSGPFAFNIYYTFRVEEAMLKEKSLKHKNNDKNANIRSQG